MNHPANLQEPLRSLRRGVHLNKNESRASEYVRRGHRSNKNNRKGATRDIRVTSCTANYHCPLYIQGHKLAKLLAHFGPPTSTRNTVPFLIRVSDGVTLRPRIPPLSLSKLTFVQTASLSFSSRLRENHVPLRVQKNLTQQPSTNVGTIDSNHLWPFRSRTKGFDGHVSGIPIKSSLNGATASMVNIENKCCGTRSEIGFEIRSRRTHSRIYGFGNCIRSRRLS